MVHFGDLSPRAAAKLLGHHEQASTDESLGFRSERAKIGDLIIRIGVFGAHYTTNILRDPQNSIGIH